MTTMESKKGIKGKNIYEQIENIIDTTTGEVITTKKLITRKIKAESFMRVYLEDFSGFLGISSKSDYKVLFLLWDLSGYNTNEIILVKPIKERIADRIGVTYNHIRNCISSLTKKGVLIRTGSSVYVLNPKYFFKGAEIERSKVIEIIQRYEIEEGATEELTPKNKNNDN